MDPQRVVQPLTTSHYVLMQVIDRVIILSLNVLGWRFGEWVGIEMHILLFPTVV
jgi:hypothetical protein